MKMLSSAVALVAAMVAGCGTSDPDADIRALLAAAEGAAEARDAGSFADKSAEDPGIARLGGGYRDSAGRDRTELLRMLRGYFIANQRIEVVARVDEVAL